MDRESLARMADAEDKQDITIPKIERKSSAKNLRLAIAEVIQQYRLTRTLPLYEAHELRTVVDAWLPFFIEAQVPARWLNDLFIFACLRRTSEFPMGADAMAREWPALKERKHAAIYAAYLHAMDTAVTEHDKAAAVREYDRKKAELEG